MTLLLLATAALWSLQLLVCEPPHWPTCHQNPNTHVAAKLAQKIYTVVALCSSKFSLQSLPTNDTGPTLCLCQFMYFAVQFLYCNRANVMLVWVQWLTGPGTVLCDQLCYVFMFLSVATSNLIATSLAHKVSSSSYMALISTTMMDITVHLE